MNAKEAFELASSRDDVSQFLKIIKAAAEIGMTEAKMPRLLNQFEVAKLVELGYRVRSTNRHTQTMYSGSLASPTDCHEVRWGDLDTQDRATAEFKLTMGALK